MRTLPAELTAELAKETYFRKHLFVLEFTSGTKRYTDCDQDIYYGGAWYYARGVKFDEAKFSLSSKIDSITIKIPDVDSTIEHIMLTESIFDRVVTVYLVALDVSVQVLGLATPIYYGYIDSGEKPQNDINVSIKVMSEFSKWRLLTPRLVCSPTCMWDFKKGPDKVLGTNASTYTCIKNNYGDSYNKPITGANWSTYWALAGSGGVTWVDQRFYMKGTCRYAGAETWCDKSYERCLALSNTLHFMGMRWIPGLQGKEIWWGQFPIKSEASI